MPDQVLTVDIGSCHKFITIINKTTKEHQNLLVDWLLLHPGLSLLILAILLKTRLQLRASMLIIA